MTFRNSLLAMAVFGATTAAAEPPQSTRQAYLDLAKAAYRQSVETCPAAVEKWITTYEPDAFWGYTPPGDPVWLAGLAGSL